MSSKPDLDVLFGGAMDYMDRPGISGNHLRLSEEQVEMLRGAGCTSGDWSLVAASPESDLGVVRKCRFEGRVNLSLVPVTLNGETVEPLLADSSLENVDVGPGCRVESVGLLRNVVLEEGVRIRRCGVVTFTGGAACGNLQKLELGVETGERNVGSLLMLDVDTAYALSGGEDRLSLIRAYRKGLEKFSGFLAGIRKGRICREARLVDTGVIEDCFIGSGAVVDNAVAVRNSMLMDGAVVMDGALVRNSIMKRGSMVDSMAVVERSMVGEAALVERHGKLVASFLGPNSVLGGGEITASLVGPFTSCHHQSLLIAARWPMGRGNVGYGANVGSNHTSRLPDQEIRPGEGMFFGLACSVKFPSDFSGAPYTIIATGITTLPQRVEFPFSLICQPFVRPEGVPPAYNQIIPGWMLYRNMYALARNERKFAERNRASRWRPRETRIIRAETVEMMLKALDRLQVETTADFYTDGEIPGLGKNFMTEEDRRSAMEAYRFHVDLFVLEKLLEEGVAPEEEDLVSSLAEKRFRGRSKREMKELLNEMKARMAFMIEESRKRDDARGAAVIDDYLLVRKERGGV